MRVGEIAGGGPGPAAAAAVAWQDYGSQFKRRSGYSNRRRLTECCQATCCKLRVSADEHFSAARGAAAAPLPNEMPGTVDPDLSFVAEMMVTTGEAMGDCKWKVVKAVKQLKQRWCAVTSFFLQKKAEYHHPAGHSGMRHWFDPRIGSAHCVA